MIRSICFSPVIDRMYFIDDFSVNSKFREITPQICVGGKGVNIARVAAQLSEPITLYAFIGGRGGQLIRDEMSQHKVDFKYCDTGFETRTTINIIDTKNHKETEITEAGEEISVQQIKYLLDMLHNDISSRDIVICSGIPMAGMPSGVYKTISSFCDEKGAMCVLDTNNRYMMESLPGKFTFMKPNLLEIKELHNINTTLDDTQMLKLAHKTLDMGIKNLLISTGKSGGNFYSKDGNFKITVPDKSVVSTIGSGDSTVAGFCVALKREYTMIDCLKFAMACGVCNAMYSKVGYVEKELVNMLMNEIKVQPI